MKKIIIVFLLIANSVFSQESTQQFPDRFNIKHDQLNLDIELLGIGISVTRSMGERMGIGMGFQLGYGMRYILNNPEFLFKVGGCDSGDCTSVRKLKGAYDLNAEFIKVNLFWRYHFTQATYVNAGAFGSIGSMVGDDLGTTNYFSGLHLDIFTGLKKFKMGLKTQAGKSFLSYSSQSRSNFFLITITPALQVYF